MRGGKQWCGAAALVASLLVTAGATTAAPQEDSGRGRWWSDGAPARVQRARSGLEQAREALAALGEVDLAERAELLMRELRERTERRGLAWDLEPRSSPLDDRATRVEIIGLARHAHAGAGNEEAADALARFQRIGRMQLEGRDPNTEPGLARGLTMERLIELIGAAAEIHREAGRPEAARRCAELAEFYARRERERAAGEGGEEAPPRRVLDLTDRAQRVEILRWTLAAHREAGHEGAVKYLERLVRVGEMQLEGVPREELEKHLEGLSMERTIELVRGASRLWAAKGWEGRAAASAELARFYEARLSGRDPQEAAREARERAADRQSGERGDAEGAERGLLERDELRRRVAEKEQLAAERARLEAQLAELRAELERLRAKLEEREREREREHEHEDGGGGGHR